MLLPVPFHKSLKDTDCGPLALKMVLEYFGKKLPIEQIAKEEKQLETGLVWTLGILRAAHKLGFRAKLISTTNFSHTEDIDYYKKYANDKGMLVLKELEKEAKQLNLDVEEKNMPLNELLGYVTENSVPIVLINWFVVAGKEGFSGHFVPLVGFDEENVYVHNPGIASAQPYLKVKRAKFVQAWESKGTDKDCVVVFKPK